eukprot:4076874-Pleurochrysis_carterae.AAC.5
MTTPRVLITHAVPYGYAVVTCTSRIRWLQRPFGACSGTSKAGDHSDFRLKRHVRIDSLYRNKVLGQKAGAATASIRARILTATDRGSSPPEAQRHHERSRKDLLACIQGAGLLIAKHGDISRDTRGQVQK